MNAEVAQGNEENIAADPAAQLAQANERIARMSRELDDLQIEQKLTHKLAAAGALDLETAVVLAKARLTSRASEHGGSAGERGRSPYEEIDACLAQLRKEKAYLFGGTAEAAAGRKTAGVKDRAPTRPTALEQAAQKAVHTGSRADLHHYLRLRQTR
jgi:hypothetical protein